MERHSRVHLDHPTIRGRIRSPQLRHARPQSTASSDIRNIQPSNTAPQPTVAKPQPVSSQAPQPSVKQPNVLKNRTTSIPAKPGKAAHLPRQSRSGVLRRQMVKSSSKKFRPKKHHSYKPYLLTGLATFVLVLGGTISLVAYKKMRTDSNMTAVLAKQAIKQNMDTTDNGTSGSDLPSEDNPPLDITSYTVADTMPRYLIIDMLGVKARVRRVGADNNDIVKGPSNIYDTGWYENSSLPGQNGTTLIDGHVAGQANRGVFYGLNTLKNGDKITVERGDGKRITYTVAKVEQTDFDKLDMKKVLNSVTPGKPGLNLMTASNRFNIRTNQYEKRVIIYTTQD